MGIVSARSPRQNPNLGLCACFASRKKNRWYRRPGETAAGGPRPVARRATFAVHRRYLCTSVRSSHLASGRRTSVVVKGLQCASPGALNTNRAAKLTIDISGPPFGRLKRRFISIHFPFPPYQNVRPDRAPKNLKSNRSVPRSSQELRREEGGEPNRRWTS